MAGDVVPHESWDWRWSIKRMSGGVMAALGLWHAAAPWSLGYADRRAAAVNDVLTGLGLAAVGVALVARGPRWLIYPAAAIALWMLLAPWALGADPPSMVGYEAIRAGSVALALVAVNAADRWLAQVGRRRAA